MARRLKPAEGASGRRRRRGGEDEATLFELPDLGPGHRKDEHPARRFLRWEGTNQELIEYLDSLRQSNCPGCGRVQYTRRGEPVGCPTCVGGKESISRTSVPMGIDDRRGREE